MSLAGLVGQIWLSMVGTDNTRLVGTRPVEGLIGAVVTLGKAALGAWAQLVAAATITNPSWLSGVTFDSDADDVDAATSTRSLDVQLGTGGAGSEVAIAAASFGITHTKLTAVGEWTTVYPLAYFPRMIRLSGQPRVAARGATSNCAATLALGVKALFATALAT